MQTWHTLEDRQSAVLTTRIRDEARRAGFEADYGRCGWTTFVAVLCTDEQWQQIVTRARG